MRAWLLRSLVFFFLVSVVCALALPYVLPGALAWLHSEIQFRGDAKRKVLFVTIDDAPSGATAEIETVLAKYRVPATFFIIGDHVRSDAQLTSIVAAGYSLGHHMRTTERCSKLPFDRFRTEFDFTDRLLRRFDVPRYFRPPSDFGTPEQMGYVRSKAYQPVLGTVFPLDHWIQRPSILALLVRWLAIPGGIVIMHDGDLRGHTTAQVLDQVIPILQRNGYEFGALFPSRPIQPSTAATDAPGARGP
jgi:peptidoglycan-N-acetylglucosamine deacetylase